MGLSSLWKGKKKYYSYNNPDFAYAQGYNFDPSRGMQFVSPLLDDFMGYGKYTGFNRLAGGLELLFEDRDLVDTDYRIFDPRTQKWSAMEDAPDAAMMEQLQSNDWLREEDFYGDPYQRSLYYTPWEVALGVETGRVPGMTATGKTASQNWASIHPNVGYDFWDNSILANLSFVPGIDNFSLGPIKRIGLGSISGVSAWQDPSVSDWDQGFISETNPWGSGVDADYTTGSGSYRTGGLFGVLGPILSFVPGLQWVGMAMTALNAAGHKNPLGVVTAFLPGLGQLGNIGTAAADMSQLMSQGLSASQAASIAGNAWGASSGLLSGLSSLGMLDSMAGISSGFDSLSSMYSGINPYIRNSAMGGLSSSLNGGNFATGALGGAIGTGIGQYVSPSIYNALTETGLSSDLAKGFTQYLSGLGTNVATSYLSTLGDSDNYSEATSRMVSNATPTQSMFSYDQPSSAVTEGISSGYGLPQWMTSTPTESKDQAKGEMSNNQLGSGWNANEGTKYLVG